MKKRISILIEIALLFFIGCAVIGGPESNPITKPVAKLQTDLETVKKDIDKSKKQLENITGDVSMFEQRISIMETNVITIQSQISVIKTENIQYNESIKSIVWALAIIWMVIKTIGFIQMLIAAKVMPGKMIKNVFTLPWEKK